MRVFIAALIAVACVIFLAVQAGRYIECNAAGKLFVRTPFTYECIDR